MPYFRLDQQPIPPELLQALPQQPHRPNQITHPKNLYFTQTYVQTILDW